MPKYLTVRGARVNNLKNIGNPLSHLIPFMRKDIAGLWKAFLPMPGCFWDRWTSRI